MDPEELLKEFTQWLHDHALIDGEIDLDDFFEDPDYSGAVINKFMQSIE